MLKVMILIGSTRSERRGRQVAEVFQKMIVPASEYQVDLVDLVDYPLPFYDEAGMPSMLNGKFSNEVAIKWNQKVMEYDAYVVVTPEYNHGYTAVLKNALDYPYQAWNNKPMGFVSYGGRAGGARGVEQLRQVIIELQMAPIREQIVIPRVRSAFEPAGYVNTPEFAEDVKDLFDQLIWWAKALKTARESA